ncbi:PilZ domain-containing protein [Pseudodesulfovibrio piezophilus]|uniref:Type IV pilus assembly PilZ (Modular protein) n=1 Tax=Pseudodesulfovibrio piezophilus (strain DSM 21447 / JCM 15486 / C1TLV30) TaxID=1322246 RepID=M1WUH2_PSEP2|nr:PilZ domain-containing protein [Pseudodesulfovibrio piezophilus]CCH47333.1 Type IV pilus assembly PilZ (modular protein) [Pseudodesulfovibrio piezophilus C1TLV30]
MDFFHLITALFCKKRKQSSSGTKSTVRVQKGASSNKKNGTKADSVKNDFPSESSFLPPNPSVKDLTCKEQNRQRSKKDTTTQSDGFCISLKEKDAQGKKRNALRLEIEGLEVHVIRLKSHFQVTDISTTGLGFAFEKPRLKSGVILKMDLYLHGTLKVSGLSCKVKRHTYGSVGCLFTKLDKAQDDKVHEIVLMGQKKIIQRKQTRFKDKDD